MMTTTCLIFVAATVAPGAGPAGSGPAEERFVDGVPVQPVNPSPMAVMAAAAQTLLRIPSMLDPLLQREVRGRYGHGKTMNPSANRPSAPAGPVGDWPVVGRSRAVTVTQDD